MENFMVFQLIVSIALICIAIGFYIIGKQVFKNTKKK